MSHQGWGPAAPIFRVGDLRRSLDYYVQRLGFRVDWNEAGIASVSRDRCCIFLCEGEQGCQPTWAWLGGDDIDAEHATLAARGAIIRHPPTNYSWAYEMQVADPDGNVLRIGGEPKDGPSGPFLDAAGVSWQRNADGSYTASRRERRSMHRPEPGTA